MNLRIVWASGLFEGEGCFHRNQKGASISFGMRLVSTDRDVVEAYADVIEHVAGRRPRIIYRKRREDHHKQQFAVTIVGPDAERFYTALRPWLGERRRARADAIRDEVAAYHDPARRTAVCGECGKTFTPTFGVSVKFCSTLCGQRSRDRRPSARIARVRRYWARRGSPSQEPLW